MIPLFTLIMAAFILGERLTLGEGLGAALILFGIVVAVMPSRPTNSPTAT